MLQDVPGTYSIPNNGPGAAIHQSTCHFNDDIIPAGAAFFVQIVEDHLKA